MGEKMFKASNGYEIEEEGGELLVYDKHDILYTNISEPLSGALREYFGHVHDTGLGRVRWPANPDYVIYRHPDYDDDEDGRCVRVIHEPSGHMEMVRDRWHGRSPSNRVLAAHWYFSEGPGKPERPWENAEVGEVWRLTVDGKDMSFLTKEPPSGTPYFLGQVSSLYADSKRITAGKKLLEADGSVANDKG